jgi:periplasmic protein CpxP/Spy
MKKLILIALAFIAIQATAQERKGDRSQNDRKERAQQFQNVSAEDMATLQTKKLTLHLDLNASQQKEIQKLNLENATVMKTKMEARKAAKENGSAQKPSQEDYLKMMNEKLDHQIAMKAKMKNILNADQFEKWEKSQKRMTSKHRDGDNRRGGHKGMKKQG